VPLQTQKCCLSKTCDVWNDLLLVLTGPGVASRPVQGLPWLQTTRSPLQHFVFALLRAPESECKEFEKQNVLQHCLADQANIAVRRNVGDMHLL
jgi:hypothetical protein